jgi:pyrroline-5-carboxylate reductase
MTDSSLNIAMIGCGKMGSALLELWQKEKVCDHIYIYDPYIEADSNTKNIFYYNDKAVFSKSLNKANLVLFAVKPQILKEACLDFKPHITPNTPIISIAAGQTINSIQTYLHDEQPIIRVMPNTPASIGKGVSVAYANQNAPNQAKSNTDKLFSATGFITWIEDESLMDAVTAVSGSGPAYVFHFIEALTEAAEKAGLDKKTATLLAKETLIGSAYLVEHNSTQDIKTLRENVTSPGGTTEAALNILMGDKGLSELLIKAVQSAKERGAALSKSE